MWPRRTRRPIVTDPLLMVGVSFLRDDRDLRTHSKPGQSTQKHGKVLKPDGRIIISDPDNGMKLTEFLENLHSFDAEGLRRTLNRHFQVEVCYPCEATGHRYIVAKAAKRNSLTLRMRS